ncbi:hypothetical protein [Paenibacillus wynnii]|uniref:Uncharacterized protein n=1 Tax=Paenibacillus wynnii TaxID=268407 RepID=A0A098MA24_9BACL|nr:hypothetical protein [Paenibacillus wynnii]KGE19399.1 hypothetical protein PWYN_08650 [Paenibacillus wynnii]
MIKTFNNAMDLYQDGFFKIDKIEQTENRLYLTLSLYKEALGQTAGRYQQWLLTCSEVKESSINLQDTFFYVELQQEHLALFKYQKPFFMIMGPEHIYKNEIIYGKLFVEIQSFALKYGSKKFANEFMPDLDAFSDQLVYLCNGPQEILDIYSRVLVAESLQVTALPHRQIYSDNGREQILLFGDSSYIVAENFEATAIEL